MNLITLQSRKEFIRNLSLIAGVSVLPGSLLASCSAPGSKMKLGLVTYLWAKDWDIPTIIKNCTEANILGVELRVQHAHGVNFGMSAAERLEVKKQFDDSPIEIVGMGTNEEYHSADPAKVKEAIENTKKWLQLSKDIGASGVKVKPNAFPAGVAKEKTLEQIGKALNELGNYALDMGQQIRLEVHGRETQELPNIKTIMDYVENNGSTVCWNCNDQDLNGEGLEYNFDLVKDRFGDICHVRELNVGEYPYQQLMDLFVGIDYQGWVLLECRTNPDDKVAALKEQNEVFGKMIANAQAKL
ncbi:MAG: sugar phosphate isomerase/epimerase [Prolixibacteraceae bacterium]|jgi:sugar phosphate isomerase/epimerase|nr:sugar phosphate isomerase/epimerase [Prolixibacteraceae bacterium]MBT6007435.1 sugar phosphate isomerase/epimerase [Prolixibacteraceae bacterium]MBT6996959.1 sugar phosphate isomerase/epimerase [Prolixibacteraceae bacterium]MBT7395588.1 sugar phosphate isomerase/epimerase [Prolixibacteraceae bacterium]